MHGKPFMHVDELPERPDRETGEPRPPTAPKFRSVRPAIRGSSRSADSARPVPPHDEGPTLAWEAADRYRQLRAGIVAFVLQTLGVCVLQDFDLSWMSVAWSWMVILAFSVLAAVAARRNPCAVGADWLRVGRRWVRVYELTEIATTRRRSDLYLRLKDNNGRRVTVNAEKLRERPLMWDLVYNGMLHSVVLGCARTTAYGVLELPRPADAKNS